jgi:dihydrodipicolinate synthase/N-acetylneuraminate lyase
VLAGTNGEGPSLSAPEERDLLRTAAPLAEGLELILGVATSSLDEAIRTSSQAAQLNAAACLVMPPSYFREAREEDVARWYEALMQKAAIPILLYNLPQRTGMTLSPSLLRRLASNDWCAGIKDSSGVADNLAAYASALSGTGKAMLVGDETLLWQALEAGWTGTISGAANVLPGWLSTIVREYDADRPSAETKFGLLEPAIRKLRSLPQPSANKAFLKRLGVLDSAQMVLPLAAYEGDLPDDVLRLAGAK